MSTSVKVTGFVVVLGLVFALAWLAGSIVGPIGDQTPSPPPSGHSMPGM